ncbi:hypothetical protein L202_08041 [Cryptococcus amylolentus CBS 6039]|uniref:Mesaconyl-C4 CoA hydratase n=1 Tax=Cryptococcus amylolentus CBS 6039 TaxID=1295533 RepID=A0A1E3HDM2_9TREE|nr:hypothetical protein L202_08041 [Cryptococcus amylolentus CBS 6039]ODN73541.1 hypothetical protein L202_08041 [Cryptococcus amylolentus CBS 6039]
MSIFNLLHPFFTLTFVPMLQRSMNPLYRSQRPSTRTLFPRRIHTPPSLQQWIDHITARSPQRSHDILDPDRASQLQRALPTRQGGGYIDDLPGGAVLPPAHHLVYFRPRPMLRDLGEDGSATELNPPAPFLRRMWAGGEFQWPSLFPPATLSSSPPSFSPPSSFSSSSSPANVLKVGELVTQVLTIPKVEYKKGKVFVHQERVLYPGSVRSDELTLGGDGWAVKETRIHVFQTAEERPTDKPSSPSLTSSPPAPPSISTPDPIYTHTYTPTTPLLFLFSALTHNPHKIHYDHPFSVSHQHQKGTLVHGPLSALILVEIADSVARQGTEGGDKAKRMVGFEYRATGAMVVDREVVTSAWWEGEVLALESRQGGKVGMKARARFV